MNCGTTCRRVVRERVTDPLAAQSTTDVPEIPDFPPESRVVWKLARAKGELYWRGRTVWKKGEPFFFS
jgi:hypothetical protein